MFPPKTAGFPYVICPPGRERIGAEDYVLFLKLSVNSSFKKIFL